MNQTTKQPVKRSTCQWDCTGQNRLDQTPDEPQVCSTTVEGYPLLVIIYHSNVQGHRGHAHFYLEVDGLDTPLPTGVDRRIGVSSSLLARAERMARRHIRNNDLPVPMPQPERQEVPDELDIPF